MNTYHFDQAFNAFIAGRKVVAWGFLHEHKVLLPNGFAAYPCGYFTKYDNGYTFICNGARLGNTPIQEALILNEDGIPIARDTEDLKFLEE